MMAREREALAREALAGEELSSEALGSETQGMKVAGLGSAGQAERRIDLSYSQRPLTTDQLLYNHAYTHQHT